MSLTKYMKIDKPKLYESLPSWLEKIHNFIKITDNHDHSEGRGKRLGVDSLNINSTLSFNNNSAYNLYNLNFDNISDLEAVPPYSIFFYDGDIWLITTGDPIRLTINGEFNKSLIGGIGGDYGGDSSIVYIEADNTFYFTYQGLESNLELNKIGVTGENPVSVIYLAPDNVDTTTYTLTLPDSLQTHDGLIITPPHGHLNIYPTTGATPNSFVKVLNGGGYSFEDITFNFITADETRLYEPLRYGSTGNITFNSNKGILFAKGNTSERPETPLIGSIRYNTTINNLEVFKTNWETIIAVSEEGFTLNNLSNVVIPPDTPSGILTYNQTTEQWYVEGYTDIDFEEVGRIINIPDDVTDLSTHSIFELNDIYDDSGGLPIDNFVLKFYEGDEVSPVGFYLAPSTSSSVIWSGISGDISEQKDIINSNFSTEEYYIEGKEPGLFDFMVEQDEQIPFMRYSFPNVWLDKTEGSIFDFRNIVTTPLDLQEGQVLRSLAVLEEGKPPQLGFTNHTLPQGELSPLTNTADLYTHNGTEGVALKASQAPLAFLQADASAPEGLKWMTSNDAPPVEYYNNTYPITINITTASAGAIQQVPVSLTTSNLIDFKLDYKTGLTSTLEVLFDSVVVISVVNNAVNINTTILKNVIVKAHWGEGNFIDRTGEEFFISPMDSDGFRLEVAGLVEYIFTAPQITYNTITLKTPLSHVIAYLNQPSLTDNIETFSYTSLPETLEIPEEFSKRRVFFASDNELYGYINQPLDIINDLGSFKLFKRDLTLNTLVEIQSFNARTWRLPGGVYSTNGAGGQSPIAKAIKFPTGYLYYVSTELSEEGGYLLASALHPKDLGTVPTKERSNWFGFATKYYYHNRLRFYGVDYQEGGAGSFTNSKTYPNTKSFEFFSQDSLFLRDRGHYRVKPVSPDPDLPFYKAVRDLEISAVRREIVVTSINFSGGLEVGNLFKITLLKSGEQTSGFGTIGNEYGRVYASSKLTYNTLTIKDDLENIIPVVDCDFKLLRDGNTILAPISTIGFKGLSVIISPISLFQTEVSENDFNRLFLPLNIMPTNPRVIGVDYDSEGYLKKVYITSKSEAEPFDVIVLDVETTLDGYDFSFDGDVFGSVRRIEKGVDYV